MPKFHVEVPHQLGQETAVERMKSFLERVRKRYEDQVKNLQIDWRENALDCSFRTYGFNIKGGVDVQPDKVDVSGDIPFAAAMFKGRIESSIRDELEKVLSDRQQA